MTSRTNRQLTTAHLIPMAQQLLKDVDEFHSKFGSQLGNQRKTLRNSREDYGYNNLVERYNNLVSQYYGICNTIEKAPPCVEIENDLLKSDKVLNYNKPIMEQMKSTIIKPKLAYIN